MAINPQSPFAPGGRMAPKMAAQPAPGQNPLSPFAPGQRMDSSQPVQTPEPPQLATGDASWANPSFEETASKLPFGQQTQPASSLGGPGGVQAPGNMPAVGGGSPAQPTSYQMGGKVGQYPSPSPYDNAPTGPAQPFQQQAPQAPQQGEYNSEINGMSAINPQAGMADYNGLKRFEDAAFNQAMQRLNPQLQQQSTTFDQQMVNRGIPVGSEAYQEAKQQMDFNQNDARSSAAFNAMGFGQNVQNQMFGQDAQRAGLANSLLQAQMGNKLGYAGLNEQGRQFNQGMNEQGRQFDSTFGEGQRRFNDQSNYQWDRAQMNDLGWLANFDRQGQQYNDTQDWQTFNARQGLLGSVPGWNPAMIDVNGAGNTATNSQEAAFNAQNAMNQQAWSQITDVVGMGAMALSDKRLKDNVEKVGEIGNTNIYRWTWNKIAKRLGLGNQATIGVIAQEVPAEFVAVRNGYLAVNYEGLLNATS